MEKRKIFFNEELHKYTDEYGSPYISTTTIISNYYDKFNSIEVARACARIGRNPNHPKYLKYKGKSEKQILHEWGNTRDVALDKGKDKHNYLEQTIRSSTGYKLISGSFINDRIYTLDDVIGDRKIGLLNIGYFEDHGIHERYPLIFDTIYKLTKNGYLIYAEIGVYDSTNLVSGLIDIILIRGNEFIILDWKTNAAPIRFEAGYYDKDIKGNRTNIFINRDDYFNHPISHLPASVGNKYSLQLSGYANMAELFGLIYRGSILCHIKTIDTMKFDGDTIKEVEQVEFVKVADLRSEFTRIKEHNFNTTHFKEPVNKLF